MRTKLGWFSGFILLIGAILGIGLSLVGTWAVWRSVPLINSQVNSILDLFDGTLETSAQGLQIVNDSLTQTVDTVTYLQTATVNLSNSLDQTIPFLDNVGNLVGNDMTTVVANTETSLQSAETSAKLVDDTLRVITSIPLIGNIIGNRYAPAVPLSESLGNVADSLSTLPDSLTKIQTGLTDTANSLRDIQTEVDVLKGKVDETNTQLEDAQKIVSNYQTQVTTLQEKMANLRQSVPRWLNYYKWGLTVFFVWLGIAQVGLLLQGLHLITGSLGIVAMDDGQPATVIENLRREERSGENERVE